MSSLEVAFSLLIVLGLILVGAYAWRRGGEPEQIGGAIYLAIVALSLMRMSLLGLMSVRIDLAGLVTDAIGFLAFAWVALFAWRIWPLWATALQLIAVVAHLVRPLEIPLDPEVYTLMRTTPTYLVPVALVAGTINHGRRERARVSWPSWCVWSGPLNRISPTNLLRRY